MEDDSILTELKSIVGERWATNDPAIRISYHHDLRLLSTFSTTYGVSADNYVDVEFIARDGSFFSLNDITAPNLFSFQNAHSEHEAFAICISVCMKLYPVSDDEEGILVPFASLDKAVDFARNCTIRHIGLAIGILGSEFVSAFLAPTKKLASEVKGIFTQKLGMSYLVLFIGDAFALRSVCEMGHPVINQKLFTILSQGLPALKAAGWLDLMNELAEDEPFSYLKLSQFAELAETALVSSPVQQTRDIDPDEISRIQWATQEAGALLDEYSQKTGTIRQVSYVVNQSCCRKENLLYITNTAWR
jgi:hypothetical protein